MPIQGITLLLLTRLNFCILSLYHLLNVLTVDKILPKGLIKAFIHHMFTPWPFIERPEGCGRCLRLSVCLSVRELCLVCMITHHRFELVSPNFVPNMHHGIFSIGFEYRDHWHWFSSSFWPFYLRIIGNAACLHDNSSQIWAGITKFELTSWDTLGWYWKCGSDVWLRILANLSCRRITSNGFEVESPHLHQICILGLSQVLKMGVNDLDLQGHLATSTQNSKKRR